jgi:hypothetical protein
VSVEAGEREEALRAVDAALAIDPNFLAAHFLRDRILSAPARTASNPDCHAADFPPLPPASSAIHVKLEPHVKRRRVDRQLDEARAALDSGRLKDATAALGGVTALDPNSPELKLLMAQLDLLRSVEKPSSRGRWLAAAAAIASLAAGAFYIYDSSSLVPPPIVETLRQPSVPEPFESKSGLGVPIMSDYAATAANASPASIDTPHDEEQIRQVLERYRSAYERLDARSARVVWPRVNESALARTFDRLRSQELTFDDCSLAFRGGSASATCHGSARYVPKVGSRAPRIEQRTWSFRLQKNGSGWTIESARSER